MSGGDPGAAVDVERVYATCPQCHEPFALRWNDYSYTKGQSQTLFLRGCPSGGIYDVSVRCPHCKYEEEL